MNTESSLVQPRSAPVEVVRSGVVVGRIILDPKARVHRFFPGAENDVAFVFEHRSLNAVLAMVNARSWRAELSRRQPISFGSDDDLLLRRQTTVTVGENADVPAGSAR
ncbi:MAG TPA: hypothetical protein VEQ65_11375 [Opitutus sp.]|nr:hypothetical protein [Opitutus sp.]